MADYLKINHFSLNLMKPSEVRKAGDRSNCQSVHLYFDDYQGNIT